VTYATVQLSRVGMSEDKDGE